MVGSCVTFYPNCFAIDSRYYRGKDCPAFCEAHVEKDWPYEKPNASKQTMDCPAPFSRGAFLPFLCSLLLQCQPCALLLHRLHPCRACLLLGRDDFFLPYPEKPEGLSQPMDLRADCLLPRLYPVRPDPDHPDFLSGGNGYGWALILPFAQKGAGTLFHGSRTFSFTSSRTLRSPAISGGSCLLRQ